MLEARHVWELVERRAEASPTTTMSVDEHGRTITFGQYRLAAERAAAGLGEQGVAEGDVVSWQLPTWLESLTLVGALARLGAVQNPIIPIYRGREVGFCTRQVQASLLIVPSSWRGFDYDAMARSMSDANGGTPRVLVCDQALPDAAPDRLPPPPPGPPTPDEAPVRWVFYTSGTTADPKGARHTDATILAAARGMSERLDFRAGDRNGLAFPFTHIGGITWLFASLLTGGTNVLMEGFDPQRTPEVFRREGVTLAGSGTAFHLAYLEAQRRSPGTTLFPRLKSCPGGGAPKPPQLHRAVKDTLGGAGILSGWGLTEAPILTMASASDGDDALATTEGRAMPGVDLRVVPLDGRPAGPGVEGELRAKAPQLMRGYVDASLDGDAFDDEGYFRTGDLGTIDADGNVAITGRVKDIIIRNGENISAKEVEDLLFTHPKVADVAVVGLPDVRTGERACAVVSIADGQPALDFAEMGAFLRRAGLRTQAVPEQLEVVDVVPRNPTGKVLKHELRARLTTGAR